MDQNQKRMLTEVKKVIQFYEKDMPNTYQYMKKHKPLMYTGTVGDKQIYVVDFRRKMSGDYNTYVERMMESYHEPTSYFILKPSRTGLYK